MSRANVERDIGLLRHEIEQLRAEIKRLRAALQRIVDEAESDDGLTAWDGGDIASDALNVPTDQDGD